MDPYRFSVKAQLASRPQVISEVTDACRRAWPGDGELDGEPAAFVDSVVSAVSEIMNNIVLHAYDGGSDELVTFAIEVGERAVSVRVTDRGAPADFDPPAPEPPPLAEGGMGLYLIQECVDRVDYQPGPPNVWTLEKALPAGGPGRPNQE